MLQKAILRKPCFRKGVSEKDASERDRSERNASYNSPFNFYWGPLVKIGIGGFEIV